jgi:hypothetical protein
VCDYSLHGIQNRLARKGEVLVVHRFYTGSKGLTSPEYLNFDPPKPRGLMALFKRKMTIVRPRVCAICIPDGAQLIICDISLKLQQAHGLNSTEVVTFRQLTTDARTYRDAVEFKTGLKLRLQDLDEGQTVEVLALSSEEAGVHQEKHIFVPA